MPAIRTSRRSSKPPSRYHHGDLARALREETIRLIGGHGVGAITVRAVGKRLGVSRTALYRHYPDKSALLAAVAAEGFVLLRRELLAVWSAGSADLIGFAAMGVAYVSFAQSHPSHYRVMFGGAVTDQAIGGQLDGESTDAFAVLLDAVVTLQRSKHARADDPIVMAGYAWSCVHGTAMLCIDGLLPPSIDHRTLISYAIGRIRDGIAPG